jgi:hypothetical protein
MQCLQQSCLQPGACVGVDGLHCISGTCDLCGETCDANTQELNVLSCTFKNCEDLPYHQDCLEKVNMPEQQQHRLAQDTPCRITPCWETHSHVKHLVMKRTMSPSISSVLSWPHYIVPRGSMQSRQHASSPPSASLHCRMHQRAAVYKVWQSHNKPVHVPCHVVSLQYLKSIRLERNRKTGFKCPRGCGKGTKHSGPCPGKIDKSHPIHPRNEEQKKKKKVRPQASSWPDKQSIVTQQPGLPLLLTQ